MWIGIAAAAVVLVGGTVLGVTVLVGGGVAEKSPTRWPRRTRSFRRIRSQTPCPPSTSSPVSATGTAITFSWKNPSPEDGDLYLWNTVDLAGGGATETTEETTVTFEGAASGQVCVDVMLRRGDGRASEPVRACVE